MTQKDLIRQYASTGAIIPEYQLVKLPRNILKTYLRRRLLQAEQNDALYQLRAYEENMCSQDIRERLFKKRFENGKIRHSEYQNMPEEQRNEYVERGSNLSISMFHMSSDKTKSLYAINRMRRPGFGPTLFKYLPEEQIYEFLTFSSMSSVSVEIFDILTDPQKEFFLLNQSIRRGRMGEVFMNQIRYQMLTKVLKEKLNRGYPLHQNELNRVGDALKLQHLKVIITKDYGMSLGDFKKLPLHLRDKYEEMGGTVEP